MLKLKRFIWRSLLGVCVVTLACSVLAPGGSSRLGSVWLRSALAQLPEVDRPSTSTILGLELGPETTVISSPLNEFGYPKYARWLDDELARQVAPRENFWVLMWQAMGNFERSPEVYLQEVESRLGITISREPVLLSFSEFAQRSGSTLSHDDWQGQFDEAIKRPWSRDEFPELARWLETNEASLNLIHEAAARPKAYSPLVPAGDESPFQLIVILLPHVQSLREAARQLCVRAMLRLEAGDERGAFEDLLACHRMGVHAGRGWTLIERLVGIAIHAIAHDPTLHWLSRADLSDAGLQTRWEELAPALEPVTFADCVDVGERFMLLESLLAVQTGKAKPREILTMALGVPTHSQIEISFLDESARRVGDLLVSTVMWSSDINASLRLINQSYDEFVVAMSAPNHRQRVALMGQQMEVLRQHRSTWTMPTELLRDLFLSKEDEFETLPARLMLALFTPALEQMLEAQARHESKQAVLEGAFLVKQAMLRTGEIPNDMAQLQALLQQAGLPAPPLDPFTGEELRLLLDDRGLVIYSLGGNGRDDRGLTHGDVPNSNEYDDQRAILYLAP